MRLQCTERMGGIVSEVTAGSFVAHKVTNVLSVGIPFLLHLATLLDDLLLEEAAFGELDVGYQPSEACEVLVTTRAINILFVGVHLRRVRLKLKTSTGKAYEVMVLLASLVTLEVLGANITCDVTMAIHFVSVILREGLEGKFALGAYGWLLLKDLLAMRRWHLDGGGW
jgi:hypothetical protein